MAWRRNPFDADVDKYGNMVQGLRLKSSVQPNPGLPPAYNEGVLNAGMKIDPARIAAGRPMTPTAPQSMIDPGRLPAQAAVTPMRAPTNQELRVPNKAVPTFGPEALKGTGVDPKYFELIKKMIEAARSGNALVGY